MDLKGSGEIMSNWTSVKYNTPQVGKIVMVIHEDQMKAARLLGGGVMKDDGSMLLAWGIEGGKRVHDVTHYYEVPEIGL